MYLYLGRFVVDERKRIELNVPDLTGFKVSTSFHEVIGRGGNLK